MIIFFKFFVVNPGSILLRFFKVSKRKLN